MSARAGGRLDPASFPSLGPGQLRPGRDVDALDGVVPQAVITAREVEHVALTIAEARAKRLGVVTTGGGTMLHVGAPPSAYDIRLSMTAIGDIVEQNPEDMTITCEAGVSLSRLQRSLAKAGQRLAIDVAHDDRASIGGIVAADATGGLRHAFGTPRDLLLGVSALDGCGRAIEAGGRVVKNVAGYDLVRLLAGSRGSLAVLTRMTLRTHPLPVAGATLLFEFVSPAEFEAARVRLLAEPLALAAVDFAVDASEGAPLWILVVRVEGSVDEVAFQGDRVCAAVARDPADALEDWTSPAWIDGEGGLTLSVRTRPTDLVAVVRDALAAARAATPSRGAASLRAAGHLGAGIARFHVDSVDGSEPALHALLAATAPRAAASHGNSPGGTGQAGPVLSRAIERAPLVVKRGAGAWAPVPPSLPLMRELKRRFDPDGVLAPGRLAGGL